MHNECNMPNSDEVGYLLNTENLKSYKNSMGEIYRIDIINDIDITKEGYQFRSNGTLKQYGFFNKHFKEPVFIINYDEKCTIDSIMGSFIYLESNVKEDRTIDTNFIEMYINVANPITYTTVIEINEISDGKRILIENTKMNSNEIYVRIEDINKELNEYVIIGTINKGKNLLLTDSIEFNFTYPISNNSITETVN
jgi:hypothetical protein